MKFVLVVIFGVFVLASSQAQDTRVIYPLFKTKDDWIRGMQVVAPSIKQIWSKDFEEMFLGLFDWNGTIYVCAYPLRPANYPLKEKFEEWKLLGSDGREVSLSGVQTDSISEIVLTGIMLRSDFSYVESPFYFGRPIPLDKRMGDSVRIVLPNVAMAFDYSLKEKSLKGLWRVKTARTFEKME